MKRNKLIALMVVCAIVIIAAEVLINIYFPEIFLNFEWYGKVIMALLSTLVLILIVRSYASVTGTYLTAKFQMSGGIVIFLLVFASSFTREIFFNNTDFNFSIAVSNYNKKLMPANMEIFFLEGTYRPSAKFDENGIANFLNVQSRFKNQKVRFQLLNSDDYTITKNTETTLLGNQKTVSISLERNDFLIGKIIDTSYMPVDSALVRIDDLDTSIYTNANGMFKLKLPDSNKKLVYDISVRKGKARATGEVSLNTLSEFMLNN